MDKGWTMARKTVFCIVLLKCICVNAFTQDNIVKFDNRLAVSFSNKYNFIEYFQGMDKGFYSYDIINVGLGISYKNALFNFGITLPMVTFINPSTTALDTGFKYSMDKYYFEGNLEYYNNFFYGGKSVNMEILSVGLFGQYVFNNQNHSLGSVYGLNSHQLKSTGSLLMGADAFFSYMNTNDKAHSIDENNFIMFGPSIGYSYIFVLETGWFCNAMAVLAPNIGISYENVDFCFAPQIRPKLAFGHHGKLWSANIIFESNFSFYIRAEKPVSALETASAGFTISRRF